MHSLFVSNTGHVSVVAISCLFLEGFTSVGTANIRACCFQSSEGSDNIVHVLNRAGLYIGYKHSGVVFERY